MIAPPRSPFKGLAAFEDSEVDALFFFGREREREVVVANLLAARLTVLYGESGVGKSSLLGAAVVRELRLRAPGAVVSLHDVWSGGAAGVTAAVREADEGYLILDQFEEYFLYHGDADGPGALLHDLPELLRDSRVNVLISLREDAIAQLDAFKARIPSVFGNQIRLEHLDREAARAAIVGPVARWNELSDNRIEIEPELVQAVLDEVTRDRDRVEAPYLQLVLERIWQAERDDGSRVLRLETLRRLGGAEAIVRDHLQGALASLDGEEQDVAASMFEHLVTPSGTKIAHRAPDLAEYAKVPEDVLRRVLAELTRQRIVHSVDGSDRFEIFHDVLAEPIRDWRQNRRLERARIDARRRQRRLYVFAAASLVALAIVAGLAVWAFSERSSAQSLARHARARELEATALQQLPIDPDRSVRLGLAAAHREPGDAAETVLRQALIADRLQYVRHTQGVVSAVATSPDGRLVAAAAGKSVLLSDALTGRLVRKLVSNGPLAALSFGDDGRTLIGASPQGIAQVWALPGGHPAGGRHLAARAPDGSLVLVPRRGRLSRILSKVQHLSATPDGRVLGAAVTGSDGHVHTWLFDRNGRRLHVLPQKGIKDIAFSPDGHLVATAGFGLTILWNTRTGRPVRQLLDSKNGVESVAFSPDGALLATGGHDSGVRIFTVATGERTYFLFAQTNPVNKVAWSPDGRVVASGSFDRTIDLWRVQNLVGAGSLAATLVGNREGVDALAFTPDSTRLVSGGVDGSVRVWDAEPDQQLALLGRAAGAAAAASWAGDTIAAAWTSGVVKVYDARDRRLVRTFRSKDRLAYTSLALSRDGSVIAAGSADGRTDVWNRDSGALASQVFTSPVAAVAVSPRGDLVASGDVHGNIRVWDPRSGTLRWSGTQGGTLEDVAFSAGGGALVTAGSKGSVLWSVSNGRRLHQLASPKGDVKAAFSPNGRLVAAAGSDGDGRLWFAGSGHLFRVLHGHVQRLTDVTFSRDSLHVATASADSDVRIWSVSTGKGRPLQRAAFGPVPDVDFDSTGRWIVAAAPISAVVWRSASGRQLFYLRGQQPLLTSASFAPRGPTVLTSSSDGTVRLYACTVCVDFASLVRLAEQRVAATR